MIEKERGGWTSESKSVCDKVCVCMKSRQKEVIYTMSMVCVYEEREKVHSERERGKCVRPETTVYSDKPLIHYPPHFWSICQQRIFFSSLYKRFSYDIYWRIACFISVSNFFCICYKKTPKMGGWGKHKRVSPFMQCSMVRLSEREGERGKRKRESILFL